MRVLGHHAGWLGPGGRGGVAGPVDQAGQGHPPRSAWMSRTAPQDAEPASVFSRALKLCGQQLERFAVSSVQISLLN